MTEAIEPYGEFTYSTDEAVVIVGMHDTTIFFICDDCGEAYPDPPYYTFPPEGCIEEEITPDGRTEIAHQGCTGNLCPDCIDHGDEDDDPRSRA